MMEIGERHKNPLLKRDEVEVIIDHKGKPTPSRHDLVKDMAKKLHAKENLIIINKIHTIRGKNESKVTAFIYHKEDDIPKGLLEASKKRMKAPKAKEAAPADKPAEEGKEAQNDSPAEKPAEEAPKEEKKEEEAPKEEPKEEPKPEEKKE